MENNILGEKLKEALETSTSQYDDFVWKGPRGSNRKQEVIKMIDASPEQLKEWYKHCNSMLYSKDKKYPGRYVLKDIVDDQRMKCNTELCLRWLENKYLKDIPEPRPSYPRWLFLQDIQDFLNNNIDTIKKEDYDTTPIRVITSNNIPIEFRDVSISDVIMGCIDKLGLFSREHISLRFITKLGVWLTDKEINDLTEKDKDGKTRNRIDVIKERHNLKSEITLKPNSKGLKYSELRAMLNLKTKKYSELTTDQLLVLRDKVLFRFEEEIDWHISQWEDLISKIKKIADVKGVELE
jgi:hypothetical protein